MLAWVLSWWKPPSLSLRVVVALAICDMLSSSPCVWSHRCRHLFHAGTGLSSSLCARRRRRGCCHLFCAGKGLSSSPCTWRRCWHHCHLCHTHGDGVVVVVINDVLAWGHLFVVCTEMTMSSSCSPWHWPWSWPQCHHLCHGGMELTSSPSSSPWHWPWASWRQRRHFRHAGTELLLLLSSPCHWPWGCCCCCCHPLRRGTGHGRHDDDNNVFAVHMETLSSLSSPSPFWHGVVAIIVIFAMALAMGIVSSSSMLLLLEVVVGVIALVAHHGYRCHAGGQ